MLSASNLMGGLTVLPQFCTIGDSRKLCCDSEILEGFFYAFKVALGQSWFCVAGSICLLFVNNLFLFLTLNKKGKDVYFK